MWVSSWGFDCPGKRVTKVASFIPISRAVGRIEASRNAFFKLGSSPIFDDKSNVSRVRLESVFMLD